MHACAQKSVSLKEFDLLENKHVSSLHPFTLSRSDTHTHTPTPSHNPTLSLSPISISFSLSHTRTHTRFLSKHQFLSLSLTHMTPLSITHPLSFILISLSLSQNLCPPIKFCFIVILLIFYHFCQLKICISFVKLTFLMYFPTKVFY